MLTAANAFFTQILMDLAVPIHPAAFQPRVFYPAEKTLVFLITLRQLVLAPGVITTWMNRHHPAQPTYRTLIRMSFNERVPQSHSLAQYAGGFCKMSRSSDARFSSAFSQRFAACMPAS